MEVIKTKMEEGEEVDPSSGVSALLAPLVKLAVKEDKPQNQQENTNKLNLHLTAPLSF